MLKNKTPLKPIPFLHEKYFITHDGEILDIEKNKIELSKFNEKNNLKVTLKTLVFIGYHYFNWAPKYWDKFYIDFNSDSYHGPETMFFKLTKPTESLEYPGFYLIPYYSNYLISKEGVLLNKITGQFPVANKANTGYYTYRVTSDSNKTSNQLRHRLMCMAFKTCNVPFRDCDIDHINGIPGDDRLENLEWVSRSENIKRAIDLGLWNTNQHVEVRNIHTGDVMIFASMNRAAEFFNVTQTTISNRCKSNGKGNYNGFQFREYPNREKWPGVEESGDYIARFPDNTIKRVTCQEAANLAGVTRTSLLRILREGRNKGKTEVLIERYKSPLS